MISLLILVAIIGLVAWVLVSFIPMPPPFKTIIIVVAALLVLLLVLRAIGFSDVAVPQLETE